MNGGSYDHWKDEEEGLSIRCRLLWMYRPLVRWLGSGLAQLMRVCQYRCMYAPPIGHTMELIVNLLFHGLSPLLPISLQDQGTFDLDRETYKVVRVFFSFSIIFSPREARCFNIKESRLDLQKADCLCRSSRV